MDALVPPDDYGSVIVTFNNIQFSITTFRREHSYLDHRHPDEVQYVDNLYQDLLRRDFTINSICMDKDENIIDLLHGKDDMNKKFIRTIGNSDQKFSQDALRILRAIRFATTLDFVLQMMLIRRLLNIKNYFLRFLMREKEKSWIRFLLVPMLRGGFLY